MKARQASINSGYRLVRLLVSVLAGALACTETSAQAYPEYQAARGISGKLSSRGSDTLNNLMTFWTEAFVAHYPAVAVEVQGAGSSTAPPALAEGAANLAPMSRQMKAKEVEAFERRYGYKPTAVPVAIDALAVFVHRDNPLEAISLPEIDAVFSSTRVCGESGDVRRWGQLNVSGKSRRRRIALYGRNSVSGTYGYFKSVALCKGDFKSSVAEQPGSSSVVQSVGNNLYGIGYSGFGYLTSSVKALAVSEEKGGESYVPTEENAAGGYYPLARYLYVYVNKPPGRSLPPTEREFLKLVLSKQGQDLVTKGGYVQLPVDKVKDIRRDLAL